MLRNAKEAALNGQQLKPCVSFVKQIGKFKKHTKLKGKQVKLVLILSQVEEGLANV